MDHPKDYSLFGLGLPGYIYIYGLSTPMIFPKASSASFNLHVLPWLLEVLHLHLVELPLSPGSRFGKTRKNPWKPWEVVGFPPFCWGLTIHHTAKHGVIWVPGMFLYPWNQPHFLEKTFIVPFGESTTVTVKNGWPRTSGVNTHHEHTDQVLLGDMFLLGINPRKIGTWIVFPLFWGGASFLLHRTVRVPFFSKFHLRHVPRGISSSAAKDVLFQATESWKGVWRGLSRAY